METNYSMPCKINNPSKYELSSLEPHIQGLYDHFNQKLGFSKPSELFLNSDPSNQSKVLGKTAYYDPQTFEVHVFVDGRHPKDILRSIAHELIHHHQNLEGRLDVGGYMGEGYYLKNKKMRKLEQEAMLKGNSLMREYEDSLKIEEKDKMTLNEWKNNELNQLLLKKFKIIKESAYMEEEQEEQEEELEEGRMNPRTTNSDKFVGHEDRYQKDRIHEEEEENEDDEVINEEEELAEEYGSDKMKKLKESIKRIARANKVILKSSKKRIK